MEVKIILLFCHLPSSQSQLQPPFSPLSLLSNIWSTVSRARNIQIFQPQLRSKFLTDDINFGDGNIYPHIIKFPYPQLKNQDFNPVVKINHQVVSPILTFNQETIETATEQYQQPSISYDEQFQYEAESPQILVDTDSENNFSNATEFPIFSLPDREKSGVRERLKLDSPNPRYAPEEFTYDYVQDPDIHQNKINDLHQEGKDNGVVKNIEETKPVFINNFENLRHINFRLTQDNDQYESQDSLKFPGKCKELNETGFCVFGPSYPSDLVSGVLENCSSLVSSFQAVVPESLDRLGDTSESVITSEKDEERPWSWRVYAYKKRQACDSQVSLSRPSYAVDSGGEPQLIIQTDSIVQRIPVDVCSNPGSACGGMAHCGLKSLCVQRYTFHYLLSLPPGLQHHCPAIRAFRLPTACVCHAEVAEDSDIFGDEENVEKSVR